MLQRPGKAGTYSIAILVRHPGVINVHLRLPIVVPPERREAVAVLLAALNRQRTMGAFDLGATDGVVGYRADIPSLDTIPSHRTVGVVIATAGGAADDALPLVARVAFAGEDPLRAAGAGA